MTPASALAAGGPGTPPILVDDVISTVEDTPAAPGNVLANDSNPGEGTLHMVSYVAVDPAVGTLTISLVDGSYTFTPAPDFTGSTTTTYTAANDKHERTANITINVTNAQDPPVAGDDTVTVTEDTATDVTAAILANDSDLDGDTISVTGTSGATGGSVSLAGGAVTFTPTGNLCGDDAGGFDYDIAATGGTDSAHVTVDITCENDVPDANDDDASGTEDTDVVIAEADLVANDTDVEGDTLGVIAVSDAHGGSVSRDGGNVTFTPDANLCGDNAAWFTYTAGDGNLGHGDATVTIDLACTADAPVAVDDDASGTEDNDVVLTASDLATNDTDADDDSLTVTAVDNASGGTVSLDSGTITFTPNANVCGDNSASFDYTVDDGQGGTDTGTVTIDLDCENDNPLAGDDTATVGEDTPTDVTSSILDNDTDADNDTLVVTNVSPATGGTVDLTGGVVTFTPNPDDCGDEAGSFDYEVSDGNGGTDEGHVTVDVTCENDGPLAVDDDASGTEDADVLIDASVLAGNDTDVDDGDTLTVSGVDGASGGTVSLDAGWVTFSPDDNLCGDDAAWFDYTVDDGHGGTDTGRVTIDLACENDAPVAVDDDDQGTEDTDVVITASDLATDDTDVEGDDLTVTAVANANGGSVSLDAGTITFTPTADLCGDNAAWFDYTVDDGNGGFDTGTVTLDLECTNDNPVAVDDDKSGTEDTDVVFPATDLTGNDTDVDTGDTLSVGILSNAHGGSVATDAGTITFTPDANLCGDNVAWFDYLVDDGHSGTDAGTVTIDVACENDAPVAVDDTATIDQDTAAANHVVLTNDTDTEDDDLSLSSVSVSAAQGTATKNGNLVNFTPANGFSGQAVITYVVSDGDKTDEGTLTITVNAVDGPDITAPNPLAPGVALAGGRVDNSAAVRVSWSATDTESGVASYQVQLKVGSKPYATIYTGAATSMTKVIAINETFYLRVRATDFDGNTSGWVTSTRHRLVTIQNIAKEVKYTTRWTWVSSLASSGDGYSYNTTKGSAASLRFFGKQIGYVAPKMAKAGYVKVFLDGHLVGRFNLKKTPTALGQVIARMTVSSGYHTIKVVNDQAGARATLDAFVILR